MGFDVTKLKADIGVLDGGLGTLVDSNTASLSARALDASHGAAEVNSSGLGLCAMSAVIEGRNTAAVLASKAAAAFDSPIIRAFSSVPPTGSLNGVDTGWRTAQKVSNIVASSATGTLMDTNSPATKTVAGIVAGGDLGKASSWGAVAESLRLLSSPPVHAEWWQSLGPFNKHDWQTSGLGAAIGGAVTRSSFARMQESFFSLDCLGPSRPYGPLIAGLGFVKSPVLDGITRLAGSYLGITQRMGELIANRAGPFGGLLGGAFEQLRRTMERWPRDPDGELVPAWNVQLYCLARAAYDENDYVARARFLNAIGADGSADNVLFIRELLAPTFDPKRPDRRTDWWHMGPTEARAWLKKRLEDRIQEERNGCWDYYDEEDRSMTRVAPSAPGAELEFLEEERKALLRQELSLMISERQLQVLMHVAEGLKYEDIAAELGIGLSTVKTYVGRVRKNPKLAKDRDLLSAVLL